MHASGTPSLVTMRGLFHLKHFCCGCKLREGVSVIAIVSMSFLLFGLISSSIQAERAEGGLQVDFNTTTGVVSLVSLVFHVLAILGLFASAYTNNKVSLQEQSISSSNFEPY